LVDVGQLTALIAQIIVDTTPPVPTPTPPPVYDLTATGTGQVRLLSLPTVNRTINEKRFNLTRPLATDTAALRAIVQNVMKDEVRQFDSISITVTTDSTTALVFSSTVTSNTSSAGNTTTRTYQLVITLRQR
jgi:CRISPR/Cas system-associated endonuclease/helicase Cas3